ncbi:UNVERIFIED_CONTAM: hypothetical protein PYX00_010255 [Menopon gallinae]|uniref:Uncharacterized protein n=1 Tax=Menopon gallinae TaxID=328185 RepID=A0AAW2HEW6_9NEOP
MESSVFVPITFWNNSKPNFRVSAIRITPNGKILVTSSPYGALSTWDLDVSQSKITPRNLLMGHSDPITCLECTDDFAISTSEGGEICRWNLDDGSCSKSVKSVFVHRRIQLFKCSRMDDELLFACGDYHKIFIIHSTLLQTVLVLNNKTDSDWMSCFHVISSLEIGHDVVSAVTKTGYIKLWIIEELSEKVSYEVQSTLLPVKNVSHLKTSLTQTQILTVSDRSWTIFDAKHLKKIFSANRICNEKFLGGDFFDSDILTWTNECKFYLYKLGVEGATLKTVFFTKHETPSVFEPATCYYNSSDQKYLVQCDVFGKLALWKATDSNSEPYLTSDLSSRLGEIQTVFRQFVKEVTCCVVINKMELFGFGFSDGSIIILSALRTTLSYSNTSLHEPERKTLLGHKGKVNCLLYPHEKYSHHNKSHLLSGGSDFSVCLWDLSECVLIHRFCVQSGEIIKLLIPPEECKMRIRHSICSVASDHSVAILNLKELKCIVLASRQLFPVVTINWRPLDDFIIIECFDGTVYIWEMETGHLDRVLHGVTAQEVIYACKESNHEDVSNFYLREDSLMGKDHFRRELFQVEKDFRVDKSRPIILRGFLDSFRSENQIVAFNVGRILDVLGEKQPPPVDRELFDRMHSLTCPGATSPTLPDTVGSKTPDLPSAKDTGKYLLSLLRNPKDLSTLFAVFSESQNVSVFLSRPAATPILNTVRTVSLLALSSVLNPEADSPNVEDRELDLQVLARTWMNKSIPLRRVGRKLLLSRLQSQTVPERSALLRRWFKYLPHFAEVDGAKVDRNDPEVADRQAAALVLFGVIGADYKFRVDDPAVEEMYLAETCAAVLHLLQSSDPQREEMRMAATNILGRGYAFWEQHLKFEKVFHYLFEMTCDFGRHCYGERTPAADRCLNAHEALISMAIARTTAFVSCLSREIGQIRNSQSPKAESAFLEKCKTEILLILSNLLERTPYMMLQHLNDAVNIFTYCVNPTRLKQGARSVASSRLWTGSGRLTRACRRRGSPSVCTTAASPSTN